MMSEAARDSAGTSSASSSSGDPRPTRAGARPDVRDAVAALTPESRRDFCVIVPAWNEVEVIGAAVRELRDLFRRHDLQGEVLVVDDGSTDGTAETARVAAEGWEALRVLSHRTNLGKTEAMVTAAAHTDRTWLVLFDADLQHLPDEIPRFLARLQEGWDMVTGRKVGRYDKRAVSSVYNRLSRRIFRVPVSDLNSMKAFRREILEDLHLRHDWHRFFVVLAHARGWSVTEIDIELLPRRAGESKYRGPFRILIGVLDLVSVWFLLLFSRKPLLLFGATGVVLITAGLLVGLVAFWLRFVHGLGFRPLLYLVILLETVGFVLFGFGLIAEMVAHVRDESDALRREVARLADVRERARTRLVNEVAPAEGGPPAEAPGRAEGGRTGEGADGRARGPGAGGGGAP